MARKLLAMGRYTFGDSAQAAVRLGMLHEAFSAVSEPFLARAAPRHPRLAVDLGCGPGHTTRMVADVLKPHRTVGLDRSASFVLASEPAPGVEFLRHDVTEIPFPCGPADVVYARHILSHLPDVADVVAGWRTQARAGGVLLLDEVEAIESADPVYRRYEELVTALLAANGTDMIAGPLVASVTTRFGGTSTTATISPPTELVARMFALNLRTWRHDPAAAALASPEEFDDLAAGLADGPARGRITWTYRQAIVPAEA